ncbi:hypothetical protein ACIBF1_10960 [Spirillospora sp. NPDC050679]
MGYELHVTRNAEWWQEGGRQITTDEWANAVAADPDLEMVGTASATIDGGIVLVYDHEWLAQMVTHPDRDEQGAWLDWCEGRIVVKNPDDLMVVKMCELARRLGAHVQGDDGEYYDE